VHDSDAREKPAPSAATAAQRSESSSVKPQPPSIRPAATSQPPPASSPATARAAHPAAAPAPERRGVVHGAAQRRTVYWLAACVAGIALANVALFVIDAALDANELRPTGVANWALLLLMLGLVQGAYALYLVQLPDWSTVWAASLLMLILAACHAMLLAVLALGGGNTPLATALELNEFADQRPELVCLMMLALTGLASYLLGRTSFRWHKSEAALGAAAAKQSA
jgi:hypothetical protein